MMTPGFRAQDQLFIPGPAFLLSDQDRYRLFARTVMPLLIEARPALAKAYCADDGRPPVDPALLLGVTVLQFWECVPDRQAVDCLRYHVGWCYAVGHPFGAPLFHPTTLVHFRQRLLQHQQSAIAFEAILKGLESSGLLPRRRKERIDSTQVLGLVSHMSRLECCRQTLALALKELVPILSESTRPAWWPVLWERYVESRFDFRAEPKVLAEKFQQTGQDGGQVLAWLKGLSPAPEGRKVRLLARVWGEEFEWVPATEAARPSTAQPSGWVTAPVTSNAAAALGVIEPVAPAVVPPPTGGALAAEATPGSASMPLVSEEFTAAPPTLSPSISLDAGQPPAALDPVPAPPPPTAVPALFLRPKTTAPAGAVHNPHEPEAQWAAKGVGRHKKEGVGYKVQIGESVDDTPLVPGEPTRQFITAIPTQPAIASDEAGLELVAAEGLARGQEPPLARYVDAAYISAEKLAQAAADGRPLIGPAQPAPRLGPRFTTEDFQVSIAQRQALCPAGQASSQCSRLEVQATGKVNFRFEWSYHCAQCPLHRQCCGTDQKHRTLLVGQYHDFLQGRRQEQKTEAFRLECRKRNALEGTQSELVRAHDLRHARYRGLLKVRLQNYLIGAACNAKRWIRRLQWKYQQERCVPASATAT
jgi:Transposase DDE domain/Transposase domain (DUF772)